jgi:hypothetical protein
MSLVSSTEIMEYFYTLINDTIDVSILIKYYGVHSVWFVWLRPLNRV